MKLVTENHAFESENFSAGILTINCDTVQELKSRIYQAREPNQGQVTAVSRSIEENGYDFGKPIIFNCEGIVVDGASRCRALCKLIESSSLQELKVPFIQAETLPDSHNDTRGLAPYDLQVLFKRTKVSGTKYGMAGRAVDQAIEASKILDVETFGFVKAFDPQRTQIHLAKIDGNTADFSQAFDTCIELLNGDCPDQFKFSHWIALFTRYGISNAAKNIARKYPVHNRGTEQKDRSDLFHVMEKEMKAKRIL